MISFYCVRLVTRATQEPQRGINRHGYLWIEHLSQNSQIHMIYLIFFHFIGQSNEYKLHLGADKGHSRTEEMGHSSKLPEIIICNPSGFMPIYTQLLPFLICSSYLFILNRNDLIRIVNSNKSINVEHSRGFWHIELIYSYRSLIPG